MKTHKIAALFAVLLAVFAVACGGRVERYMSQPGPGGTAVPPATADAGQSDSAPADDTIASQDAGKTDAVPSSDGNVPSDVQPGSDAGTGDAGSDAIAADSPADAPTDVQQDVQTDGGMTANVFLADNPVSGILVKKDQNAAVVGIGISAIKSPVTLKSLTLTCQAQIASQSCSFALQCARQACAQRITSLRIVDAATKVQFGYAMAPDPATGKATISNVNITIPANMGVNLTVVATLASTASTTEPFDKIAVGIEQPWEANIGEKTANVEADLKNQLGAAPSVVQTIRPSGTLSIADDGNPASTIVVAGQKYWVPFAKYKATAQYENAKIDRVRVMSTSYGFSDTADYAAIAVAANGQVVGQGVFIPGTQTGERDVDLSSNPIAIPKDGSVKFELWAKMAPVVAWSSSPSKTGVARSGHSSGLGIINDILTGEWDANYVGKLNVRTAGDVSGDRLYAPAALPNSQIAAAQPGNHMVLRKSKPFVTKLALASNVLQNGKDQDLFKFQLAANDAGSVAVKSLDVGFTKSGPSSVTQLRLRKGNSDLPESSYFIKVWDKVYSDVGIESDMNHGTVIIQFSMEETVSGSGSVFTLHGVANGVTSGQTMQVSFFQSGLKSNGFLTAWLAKPNPPDLYMLFFGDSLLPDSFIWSDLSESPHGYALKEQGGSRDWITNTFIEDLDQWSTQVNLSAP